MTLHRHTARAGDESGFTLIEVMVTTGILMVVSGLVMNGVLNMTQLNKTITNRTAMFAGVRNATALLQQEVGQAGRVTLANPVALAANVAAGANTVNVSTTTANAIATSGMFVGEQLVIGTGGTSETVAVTAYTDTSITATFLNNHLNTEPVSVQGAFSSGVVPTAPAATSGIKTFANGSTDWVLKIFGDVNGNNNMVYVEYTCDIANGRLYRNQMAWNALNKVAPTVDQILVENVQPNPGNAPCFVYQEKSVNGVPFVVGVAITMTVQSQEVDPITRAFQKESKALLNVSPRNVFNAWQLASLDIDNRVQPTPPQVTNLLPPLP